jgi:hypothetical protein
MAYAPVIPLVPNFINPKSLLTLKLASDVDPRTYKRVRTALAKILANLFFNEAYTHDIR